MCASGGGGGVSGEILVDTGSSIHFTNDKTNFVHGTLFPCEPLSVSGVSSTAMVSSMRGLQRIVSTTGVVFDLVSYFIPDAVISCVSEIKFLLKFSLQVHLGANGKRYFFNDMGTQITASPRVGFPSCLTFFDVVPGPERGPSPSLPIDMAFFAVSKTLSLTLIALHAFLGCLSYKHCVKTTLCVDGLVLSSKDKLPCVVCCQGRMQRTNVKRTRQQPAAASSAAPTGVAAASSAAPHGVAAASCASPDGVAARPVSHVHVAAATGVLEMSPPVRVDSDSSDEEWPDEAMTLPCDELSKMGPA